MEKLGGKAAVRSSASSASRHSAGYGRRPMMGRYDAQPPETLGMVPAVIILDCTMGLGTLSVAEKFSQHEVVVCPGLSSWVHLPGLSQRLREREPDSRGATHVSWGDRLAISDSSRESVTQPQAGFTARSGKAEWTERFVRLRRSFYGMAAAASPRPSGCYANRAFLWGENPWRTSTAILSRRRWWPELAEHQPRGCRSWPTAPRSFVPGTERSGQPRHWSA